MTVRWKPLLILSGLFLVVALVGVVAITLDAGAALLAGHPQDGARAREAGRFENSEIYYKQALQLEAKNAAIHEEFAGLYRDWMNHAPPRSRRRSVTIGWNTSSSATKSDKAAKGPRQQLLKDAMSQDLAGDAVYWAKDLLNVDADNLDAHYVLAAEALEARTPNVPEIRRHLKALDDKKASPIRRLWIRAKLADTNGDASGRDEAFAQARRRRSSRTPIPTTGWPRSGSSRWRSDPRPIRLDWRARCKTCSEQVKELGQARGPGAGAGGAAPGLARADAEGP